MVAFGARVLVSHGDALCLDDSRTSAIARSCDARGVQQRVRNAAVRHAQRDRPRAAPSAAPGAHRARRAASSTSTATPRSAWLRDGDATTLVHGHTHAPATHELAPGAVRHVLSDWELDGSSAPRAEVLRWSAAGFARIAPMAAPLARIAVTGWWQRWRRARTLERRPIPDELWQLTLARYPFLAARSAAKVDELREMATLFLAAQGIHRRRAASSSATRWRSRSRRRPACRCSSSACRGSTASSASSSTPTRSSPGASVEDEAGVVHAYDEELSGEAMQGGPVMLAWRDVEEAGESAAEGYNVVIHEFAHVVDMRGGVTAGIEHVDPGSDRGRWLGALADEYEDFADRVDADEETFLDPYAAEALEEFFAVGAEAFFVAAAGLEAEQPELYRLLAEFFRQDPARRLP